MMERLGALSPPLRYTLYLAGALMLFFLAVGVGAAAAVVADWQAGEATIGSAESNSFEASSAEAGKPEGTGEETTGATQASEDTAVDPSGDSENSNEGGNKASFAHRATDENSRGDYTVISDPSLDGHPNAIVLVSPASDRSSSGDASYEHNIGVWYAGAIRRWAIFNQDLAAVPPGSAFEVLVPQASETFVHEAGILNTAGHYTYLDNRQTNGRPDAILTVTQNWNPGGGSGVYNDHAVGTQYDAQLEKWAVYNQDGAPMPTGAAFNVAVSAGGDQGAR